MFSLTFCHFTLLCLTKLLCFIVCVSVGSFSTNTYWCTNFKAQHSICGTILQEGKYDLIIIIILLIYPKFSVFNSSIFLISFWPFLGWPVLSSPAVFALHLLWVSYEKNKLLLFFSLAMVRMTNASSNYQYNPSCFLSM